MKLPGVPRVSLSAGSRGAIQLMPKPTYIRLGSPRLAAKLASAKAPAPRLRYRLPMRDRLLLALVMLMLGVGSLVGVQEQIGKPDQDEWLRLIRNDRLDLILPSAMRDHDSHPGDVGVEWIQVPNYRIYIIGGT